MSYKQKTLKIIGLVVIWGMIFASLANAGTKTWTFDNPSDYSAYKGSGALDPANEEIVVKGGNAELSPLEKKVTHEDTSFDSGTFNNASTVTEEYLHIVPGKIATATVSSTAVGYYTSQKLTNGNNVTWQTINWQEGQYPSYGGENGLVGLWRMNEANGTAVSDRLGNSNGTLTGSEAGAIGRFGNGVQFSGATYVDIGDKLDQAGDLTVEAWVKRGALGSAQTIVSKWDNAVSSSWQLGFNAADNFEFMIDNGTSQSLITSASAYTDTTAWYHVMAVYDFKTSGTSTMDIYVNGEKAVSQITNAYGPLANSTAFLRIGNRANGDQFFNGTIDEAALYSRALSEGEAYNHFRASPNYIKAVLSSVDIQVRYALFGIGCTTQTAAWSAWLPNPTNTLTSVTGYCLQYQVKFITEDPKYNPEFEKMTITHSGVGGSYTQDNAADFTGQYMDTVSDPAETTASSESGLRKKMKISSVFNTATYNGTDIPGITGTAPNITINTSIAPYNGIFTFDNFIITAGHTVTATGTNPLIIESYGDVTINGTLDGSGKIGAGAAAASNLGGAGGPAGGGGGNSLSDASGIKGGGISGGNGGIGGSCLCGTGGGGGGGYINNGSNGLTGNTYGGGTGGALNTNIASLYGGSGGGGGGGVSAIAGGGGGGGGGMIYIKSKGNVVIAGIIKTNGGNGGNGSVTGSSTYRTSGAGGGGSGGGIKIEAVSITNNGSISATSGNGGVGVVGTGTKVGKYGGNGGAGSVGVVALYGTVSGTGTTNPVYNSAAYPNNSITNQIIALPVSQSVNYQSLLMDGGDSTTVVWKGVEFVDNRLTATAKINAQARTCYYSNCSTGANEPSAPSFTGPISISDYYEIQGGNKLNVVSPKQYLQYKAFGSGFLSSLTAFYEGGPNLYTSSPSPFVVNNTGQEFGEITAFKDNSSIIVTNGTLIDASKGTVRYQITNEAPSNNKWYRWDSSALQWVLAKNPNESGFSLATDTNEIIEIDDGTITPNIAKFDDQIGAGTLYTRVFLKTNDQKYKVSIGDLKADFYGRLTDGNPNTNPLVSFGIDTAGQTSTALQPVSVKFKTVSAIPAGGTIDIIFPTGLGVFDISAAAALEASGLGGTLSAASNAGTNTVTVTTQADGSGIAANTTVIIKLAGVKNPTTSGADTGKFSVKTKDVTGGTLDVGTAAGVEIKPDAAVIMEFTQQPACVSCVVGTVFETQPRIVLKDQYDNICKYDTSKVTLTALTSKSPRTIALLGTLTRADGLGNVNASLNGLSVVNGYAIFSGLKYLGFEDIYLEAVRTGLPSIYTQSALVMKPDAAYKVVIKSTALTQNAGTKGTMTVEIQDQYGNSQPDGAYTVTLDSTSTGVNKFYETGTTTEITGITISNFFSSGTFDYYDQKKGTPTISVVALPVGDAQALNIDAVLQQATISAAAAYKLIVTNLAFSKNAGDVGTISMEIQDVYGNPQPAGAYIITPSTTSTGVYKFFAMGTQTLLTDGKLTIANGAYQGSFDYYDEKAGTPTVTVTTTGLTVNSVSQTETINKLGANKFTIIKKDASTPLVSNTGSSAGEFAVKTQDRFGNDSPVADPISVSISTTNIQTGMFSLTNGATFETPGASISLPVTAANDTTFDYKDTIGGKPTFSAATSDLPLNSGSLQVTVSGYEFSSPADGTTKGISDTMLIKWKRETASEYVRISYSTDSGANYDKLIKSFEVGGNAPLSDPNLTLTNGEYTYSWLIPNLAAIGSNNLLQISDNAGTAKSDLKGAFNIGGSIQITSPIGSTDQANRERWSVNEKPAIQWVTAGAFDFVKIEYYSPDAGGVWKVVTGSDPSVPNGGKVAALSGSFSWNISADIPNGSEFVKIRISDWNTLNPPADDTSDIFYVTKVDEGSSVTNGQRVSEGTTVTPNILPIKWTSVGVSKVKLEYLSNLQGGYKEIAQLDSSTGVTNSFDWTVPDDISSNVAIKVTSVDSGAKVLGNPTEPSAVFTINGIIGGVKVLRGAEEANLYDVNDTLTINWKASNTINSVAFYYCRTDQDPGVWGNWTKINGLSSQNDGTETWMPSPLTGSIFVRVIYTEDLLNSVPRVYANSPAFAIGGVSLATAGGAANFVVGDNVTINGSKSGDGIKTIKVEVSYDNKFSWISVASGLVPDINSAYSTVWTVADNISNRVYLRSIGVDAFGADTNSITVQGPLNVTGKLTVSNISGSWIVGDTTRSVSWTVNKGTIPTVNIYYTSNFTTDTGSSWTKINASPVNSAVGSFTWVDAVSDTISNKVRVKAADANLTNRPETYDVNDADFGIKGDFANIAVSTVDGADKWASRRDGVISWTTPVGTISKVNLYYATDIDAGGAYTNWQTVATDISNNGSYTQWRPPVSIMTANGHNPQTDSAVGVKIQVVDASQSGNGAASVVQTSAFEVIFYKVIWLVKDMDTNGFLSGLTVTEADNEVTWPTATGLDSGKPETVTHYYPYSASLNTTWAKTDYVARTEGWVSDKDKTLNSFMQNEKLASMSYKVEVQASYDADLDAITANIWLTRRGLIIEGTELTDTVTPANSAKIAFNVFDNNGVKLNASDLGVGKSYDGNGVFSNIIYDPSAEADPALDSTKRYILKAIVTFRSQEYVGVSTFSIPAIIDYQVMIEAKYDSANDAIDANIWLARTGATVTDPGQLKFEGYPSVPPYSAIYAAGGHDANTGIYAVKWKPAGGVSTTTLYTLKGSIDYRGHTYIANKNFGRTDAPSIEEIDTKIAAQLVSQLAAQRSGISSDIGTKLSKQQTDISSDMTSQIGSQTSSLQSYINTKTSDISTIKEKVLSILEDTTAISEGESTDSASLTSSKLLNTENTVKTGQSLTVRYQSDAGLVPLLSVYNSSNSLVLSNARMSGVSTYGTTAIYEYKLTVDSSWGTGDFTITSSNGKGNMDSMVISVVSTDIDTLKADIKKLDDKVSGLNSSAGMIGTMNTMSKDLATLIETIASMEKDINSLEEDIKKDDSASLEEGALPTDNTAMLKTMYSTLATISTTLKENKDESMSAINDLYELSEESAGDMEYLKEKALELKAILDMNQNMLDSVVNKPTVKTWFERE